MKPRATRTQGKKETFSLDFRGVIQFFPCFFGFSLFLGYCGLSAVILVLFGFRFPGLPLSQFSSFFVLFVSPFPGLSSVLSSFFRFPCSPGFPLPGFVSLFLGLLLSFLLLSFSRVSVALVSFFLSFPCSLGRVALVSFFLSFSLSSGFASPLVSFFLFRFLRSLGFALVSFFLSFPFPLPGLALCSLRWFPCFP